MEVYYYKITFAIDNQIKTTVLTVNQGLNILEMFKNSVKDEKDCNKIALVEIVMFTCYGCLNDLPGQMEHMDNGGCLSYCSEDLFL